MGGRAAEELLFHEVTGGAGERLREGEPDRDDHGHEVGDGPRPGGRRRRHVGPRRPLVPRREPERVAAVRASRPPRPGRSARSSTKPTPSAYRTLVEHIDTLRRLAAYLVEHERLDGDTFNDLFEGRIDVPRATEEWRPATSRPRAWDEVAVLADRRFPRVEPAPVAIAASQVEPVAAEPTPAVALTAAVAETPAAVTPRRRPTLRRRLRHLAAGYLEQAEAWLRAPEAETDRR